MAPRDSCKNHCFPNWTGNKSAVVCVEERAGVPGLFPTSFHIFGFITASYLTPFFATAWYGFRYKIYLYVSWLLIKIYWRCISECGWCYVWALQGTCNHRGVVGLRVILWRLGYTIAYIDDYIGLPNSIENNLLSTGEFMKSMHNCFWIFRFNS